MHIVEIIRAQNTACERYQIGCDDLICLMDIETLRDLQHNLSAGVAFYLFGGDPSKLTTILGSKFVLAFPEPNKAGCMFLPKP